MAETTTAQLAELQKKVNAAFENVRTLQFDDRPAHYRIADAVNALTNSYIGTVAFVGANSAGGLQVQFNTNNTGYSSTWPQWAFDQAKSALLHGKQLWVIANGSPFGSNLTTVLILA